MSIFTEKILVASEHLQSALTDLAFHQGYDVEYPSISPGRSSLDAVEVEDSGGGGYNGYFKLSLANSSNGKLQVTIADGAGGDQICRVNRLYYSVLSWVSEEYDVYGDNVYFCLKFTEGTGDSNGKVEIVAEKSLNIESYTEVWYLLGRLIRPKSSDDGFSAYIVQDHYSSIPQMLWFGGCN